MAVNKLAVQPVGFISHAFVKNCCKEHSVSEK